VLIAFLLMFALFVNYIDRQTLSVLVRFLPGDLKMSNVTYGRIQSLFLLAYGLSMPLAGWFIDRVGTRVGLAITVTIWSAIEFLHGTARSVTTLGTYRFLLGIPEAAGLPAVSKAAAEHAAPHGRATLIGIAMFGLGMGSTLAPPVAAYLTLHMGWQWAFFGTGIAGIVWVGVWLLSYRPTPAAEAARKAEEHVPWSHLLRDRRVVGLTVARIFCDSTWWIYLFWIPPFLVQARGLDLHDMGLLGWIPYFFASIGSVAGGYASGYLVRKGWQPLRARRYVMWICALIVPFTSLVVNVMSVAGVIAILGIATFFIQAFFANIFTLPADLFSREKVASVFGLNTMSGTLAGFFTVQLAGYIVERYSYGPVFLMVAFLLPAAALLTQVLVSSEPTGHGELAHAVGD
jgi:MFS transporter, ACS family, aldohexuronate transporter